MMRALIRSEFENLFDSEPEIYFAPGRINLIGEHTDYQDGWVFPAAVAHGIYVGISPNNSDQTRLFSIDFGEEFAFNLSSFAPKKGHWANYIMGMCSQLMQAGTNIQGFDMVIGGNIPLGAGLSSSAALSVAAGIAISDQNGIKVPKESLALYAQKSEQIFAGLNCGIMDPYASAFGELGAALMLDCRAIAHKVVPINLGDYQFILVNSKVKHSLADTAYNDRREACEESVRILQSDFGPIQTLRDVSVQELDKVKDLLPEKLYPKAKHVITENQRVLDASAFLEQKALSPFGQLMNESHRSLSEDYEVSCQELDFLAKQATQLDGVLGSRMMGGGFGGCTLNLIKSSEVLNFENIIRAAYQKQFSIVPEFIPVELSQGARRLD